MEIQASEKNKLHSLFVMGCVTAFILSMVTLWHHLDIRNGIGFSDHQWLWSECVYTLHGIDSAEAVQHGIEIDGVILPDSTSTFPWTKILGILIHGAFLPYEWSCIYYVVLNFAVMSSLVLLVYRKMLATYQCHWSSICSVLLMLSSWYLTDWLVTNNNATMLCALLMIAILLQDSNELVSGVLLAFAMIKAQIALPFCFVWLLERKWKIIGTAAGIDIICWILSVLVTGVSPLRQLNNLLEMRVAMDENYLVYGIFDGLREAGIQATTVLFLSMSCGIIIIFLGYWILKKSGLDNRLWLKWSLPAMVSVFWFYKSQCDYNVLMIVALAIVEIWYFRKDVRTLLVCALTDIILLMKPISAISAGLATIRIVDREDVYYTVNRVDLYLKCIIYAVFFGYCVWCYRKNNKDVCSTAA